jgi:hypothetical protein
MKMGAQGAHGEVRRSPLLECRELAARCLMWWSTHLVNDEPDGSTQLLWNREILPAAIAHKACGVLGYGVFSACEADNKLVVNGFNVCVARQVLAQGEVAAQAMWTALVGC